MSYGLAMKKRYFTRQKPDKKTTASLENRFCFPFLFALMIILLLPLISRAEDLSCDRFPMVMGKFYSSHYAMKGMTKNIKAHAVDQMIKHLDPSKTLLYESDLEKLRPLLQEVFANPKGSNCTSLKPVYDLLVTRARENEAIVKNIMRPDFRLDETLKLNINADKRPYSKTVAEKQALLKKIVQFQIENSLLSGIDLATAKKQQVHRYELQTKRIVEQNPSQLITTSAESFATALDPHTNYLSPKNLEDLQIQLQLSLEGIGAVLKSDNGFTIIEELIPGGGAERSGMLKLKDKIIAVAQEGEKPVDVIDMDLRDVVSMIRGKKGTQVTLTILRQNKRTRRFDVTITRDKINMKEQEAKITYETRKAGNKSYRFGIIDLPSFYGGEKGGKSSYEDVKKLLAEAKNQHVDGIVLNLSRNGGGLLDDAVRIAGLFIGNGGIVATEDSRGKVKILVNGGSSLSDTEGGRGKVITFPAEDPRTLYMGPLIVLTSRLSASASEIVAGALKDYRRAVIAGSDHTFGKGSVQSLMPLPDDLGGMKVTTALYFLPGGKSTQKTGVAADVKLPGFFALEDLGEAALDYPLPAQTITPFLSARGNISPHWKAVDQSLITALAAKSQARIAKNAKFAEIIKNNKEAAEKNGIIQLSDFRKMLEKEGGKENETLVEQKQKILDQYAPFVNESVNILLDMVAL